MPPYFALALIWILIWLVQFIIRKNKRQEMLIMSLAVIPFAFFDYYSQPSYWHPQTLLSIPVGIEGVSFGFSFGGVAVALYQVGSQRSSLQVKRDFDTTNIVAISPVLFISLGLFLFFNVNMMISLPIGLLAGCFIILVRRPDLTKKLLNSGLYFGLLYVSVLALWLRMFPHAQRWWDLKIYGEVTVLNVPLGEILFGFIFSAFWGTLYEFIYSSKSETGRFPVAST